MQNDDLLTAEELAEGLHVQPSTVRSWLRAGLIPATRLTRKVVRYRLDDVVTCLEKREARKNDEQ